MARSGYPADTQVQSFLTETYMKEQTSRLDWDSKYRMLRGQNPEMNKSRQSEVFRNKIKNLAKPEIGHKLPSDSKPPRYNKRIVKQCDLPMINDEGKGRSSFEEMRPVSGGTKSMLYDGFTKEGRGRYQYLASRSRLIPECKYAFPQCSSWEYGWKISEVVRKEDIKKPQYGRTRMVEDTFFTRNGIPAVQI